MAKKFELQNTDVKDRTNAYVNGKFRGHVVKTGRSNYALHEAKNSVLNFDNKEKLKTYLVKKYS